MLLCMRIEKIADINFTTVLRESTVAESIWNSDSRSGRLMRQSAIVNDYVVNHRFRSTIGAPIPFGAKIRVQGFSYYDNDGDYHTALRMYPIEKNTGR